MPLQNKQGQFFNKLNDKTKPKYGLKIEIIQIKGKGWCDS